MVEFRLYKYSLCIVYGVEKKFQRKMLRINALICQNCNCFVNNSIIQTFHLIRGLQ